MSAEKPEVGDVWEDSKGMVHISRIFTLSDDTRAIVFIDNNNNTVLEDSAKEEHFIKMFTYSGKSKASIEDLFCVKENAKNDTQTDLRKIDDMQHDKAAYKALCEKWLKQQSEINRLREVIKRVDEQIHRIKDCPRNTTAFWQIESAKVGLNEALIGESEEE